MTTELAIQEGMQDIVQAMPEFLDGSVVINDWSVLDGQNKNAPYFIISNADNFDTKANEGEPQTDWSEVGTLCEKFTNWPTTLNNFRTRRQAIIDTFNTGNAGSAGGIAGLRLVEIRSEGGILPYNPVYGRDGYNPEVLPKYLIQHMVFAWEEF